MNNFLLKVGWSRTTPLPLVGWCHWFADDWFRIWRRYWRSSCAIHTRVHSHNGPDPHGLILRITQSCGSFHEVLQQAEKKKKVQFYHFLCGEKNKHPHNDACQQLTKEMRLVTGMEKKYPSCHQFSWSLNTFFYDFRSIHLAHKQCLEGMECRLLYWFEITTWSETLQRYQDIKSLMGNLIRTRHGYGVLVSTV